MVQRSAIGITVGIALVSHLVACPRPPEKKERRLPAVVLVDPEDGQGVLREQEPNDERNKAQRLDPAQQIKGEISSAEDEDWYRVEASQESILRAWLRSQAGGDFILEALDSAGKRLVRLDSEGGGGAEVLPNLAVSKGSFYLRVRLKDSKDALKGAPQAYSLQYAVRDAQLGEEREPNWKRELASVLNVGEDAVGFLGWKTDSDWYRVDMTAAPAGVIRAEMEGVDGVWPVLELRDAQGKLIQRRRGRAGGTVVLAEIPRTTESELYLVVRTLRTFNVEARYSLRVLVEAGKPGEREPNDRVVQASGVAPNVLAFGSLADHYDRDFFRLPIAKKTLVWIEVSPSFRLDPAVAVVDAKGEVLMEVNGGVAGEREIFPAVVASPPQLMMRLRVIRPEGADVAGRYRLRVRTRDLVGFEQEPNGKASLASPVLPAMDGAVAGFVHSAGDVDYYRLVATGERLKVRVSLPTAVEVKVSILAEGGGQTVVSRRGTGELLLDAKVISGQRYLLRIEGVKGSDARRPYRLQLMRAPEPLAIPPTPAVDEESP